MQLATLINRIKRWETVARTASHVLIDRLCDRQAVVTSGREYYL
jgi:hypothetical protein